jgi:hypothetical protein
MSYQQARSRRLIDPHGYQPLVINENVLNHDDHLEALTGPNARPCDWKSYLTPAEIESYEKAIAEIKRNRSPYWFGPAELPAVEQKRFEMVRLGVLRAFARDKYANGRRIWYGDGVPFQHRN